MAKKTLASPDKRKAQYTIDDIGLNELNRLIYRLDAIRDFRAGLGKLPRSERQAFIDFATAPDKEYAGVISMLVNQMRQAGEI